MDPFIFHAMYAWINPVENIFENQIKYSLENKEICSKLVESCAITHYKRYYPTFYIKDEGETSIAYVHNQRFWPIVVTWMNPLRAKDLKQIIKYPNGRILTKAIRSGIIQHIRTEFLPDILWQFK